MSCENWKLSLPFETTVFATVNLSTGKGISKIIEFLKHAMELKSYHNKTCGLLLEMATPWQTEEKAELQGLLRKELKSYTLEDCRADSKYLILYF